VSAPAIVLLDEPAAGLARSERHELASFVRAYVAEHDSIVIFTEHDVDLVRTLSEQVAVLDAGRLVAYGAPAEVLEDAAVREAYFGSAHA
jgi:ABC-type branched-subunit amino acid transport system ATPase component